MKPFIISAIFLFLSSQMLPAQKIRTTIGKPLVEIETEIGKVEFKYLKPGAKVNFRPFCEAYDLHHDEFLIEVIALDSNIRVDPHPSKKEWFTLTILQPVRQAHLLFNLYNDHPFQAHAAFPKDKQKPLLDRNGKIIHSNAEYGKVFQVGPERIKLDEIKFLWFSGRHRAKPSRS